MNSEHYIARRGSSTPETDVEKGSESSSDLFNHTVQSLSWDALTVTVKDRHSKEDKRILTNANGRVNCGEVLALMGPSGSGKSTMLDALAQRTSSSNARTEGTVMLNGRGIAWSTLRQLSTYVEQEDALIGSITVRETIDFAGRFALPSHINKKDRRERVDNLLRAFGLQQQANTLVGTPIRKGISGGQKRRLGVASQLITNPKVLFLDEPTSGLDSAASFEVMNYIKKIAQKYRLIVIVSVHQPSTTTFQLFDKLILLSSGRTCFNGSVSEVGRYFAQIGYSFPREYNPAEFLLDLVNSDFSFDGSATKKCDHIIQAWEESSKSQGENAISNTHHGGSNSSLPTSTSPQNQSSHKTKSRPSFPSTVTTLIHRSLLKSYRDILTYGVRIAMYTGLAIMMGTVFLRLPTTQSAIQPFINAIFFGSAFMSFMAVAYVPAYLEDRATFVKEQSNGLYGALSFTVANFLIGLPYLFLISIIFSVIAYWLSNFEPSATAFWEWVMWLFLDLLAAESLVVLVSNIFPIFVVSLAITAFANGLWMCVGGFLVPIGQLNVFWKYVFHYIDYQAYVFQGMMVNEFSRRTYDCTPASDRRGYNCMYPSDLASQGKIPGTAVLKAYSYPTGFSSREKWVGILLAITFVYRFLGWGVLFLREARKRGR